MDIDKFNNYHERNPFAQCHKMNVCGIFDRSTGLPALIYPFALSNSPACVKVLQVVPDAFQEYSPECAIHHPVVVCQ